MTARLKVWVLAAAASCAVGQVRISPVSMARLAGGKDLYVLSETGELHRCLKVSGYGTCVPVARLSVRQFAVEMRATVVNGRKVLVVLSHTQSKASPGVLTVLGEKGETLAQIELPVRCSGMSVPEAGQDVYLTAGGTTVLKYRLPQKLEWQMKAAPQAVAKVVLRQGGQLGPVVSSGDGQLLAADWVNGDLYRVDPSVGAVSLVGRGLGQVVALGVDGAKRMVYVVDAASRRLVGVPYTRVGGHMLLGAVQTVRGRFGLVEPTSVVAESFDDLVVGDKGAGRIVVMGAGGR